MGSIIFIDKSKADKLKSKGFSYVESKSSNGMTVYAFIDTVEIRKALTTEFAKNDYAISKTVNF